MHIYKIGYGSPEDSYYYEFQHEKKFTEVQLREIIAECITEVMPKVMPNNFGSCDKKFSSILLDERFEQTMLKHGFIPLKYEAIYYLSGWSSVLDDTDYFADEETKKCIRIIHKKMEGKNQTKGDDNG